MSTEMSSESLADLLNRTIDEGSSLYNKDDEGCYKIYMDSAQHACKQEMVGESAVGQSLEKACKEATLLGETGDSKGAVGILRNCFDDILQQQPKTSRNRVKFAQGPTGDDANENRVNFAQDVKGAATVWGREDENLTDYEIGMSLVNITSILKEVIRPTTNKRLTSSYENSFSGSEVIKVIKRLGLAKCHNAITKGTMLLAGGLLVSPSHPNESEFRDGTTHFYRFAEVEELQASFNKLQEKMPESGQYPEGSLESQSILALKDILNGAPAGENTGNEDRLGAGGNPLGVSSIGIKPLRHATMSPEQLKGYALAQSCIKVEKLVDIRDRKYRLKKYENCFMGNEAVDTLVAEGLCPSIEHAVELMRDLVDVGLVHHVLHEHGFENKALFYRFTSASDVQEALNTIGAYKNAKYVTKKAALRAKYEKLVDFKVPAVLNSFFGTEDEKGWDSIDVQNWKDNMKRWGFGRREDQDDQMVDSLSPLALDVDPGTWYRSLSKVERAQWESPNGILAQIAIFDQVPRSAFRGCPEAFKWDGLALDATKTAIKRGYFDSAYKSTMNQILVLMPLQHSESWEDQKLGVSMSLQMLSTAAVHDEGLSDDEIEKRLDFFKHASATFLEHAQVIAKFKQFPHRNKALSRTTTLEERIWLASDLVPPWAKPQNPEGATGGKKVINLPVIPLRKSLGKKR